MTAASVPLAEILEPAAELGEYSTVGDAAREAKDGKHVFQRIGNRWFAVRVAELAARPATRRLVDVARHEVRPLAANSRVSVAEVVGRCLGRPVTHGSLLRGGISPRGVQDYLRRRDADVSFRETIAELAHDLNNGLAFLTAILVEPDQAQRHADVGFHHLQGLVARLQQLSTGEPAGTESVELNAVIPRLIASFRAGLLLETTVDVGPGLKVVGNRLTLERVLVNLMKNACEAGAHQVEIRARRSEGGVVVDITDDGPGFETDPRGTLPPRGVSTKSPRRGLGLTASARLMHRMSGELQILDRPPMTGATLRLVFSPAS